MKARHVIIDTGPLVAFLNKNDIYHEWTVAQFSSLNPPLLTCESILSEACFLLRDYKDGMRHILTLVSRNVLTIGFRMEDEVGPITALLEKYSNLPMSLADACLVRMAEQTTDSAVLTLDKDFRVYRKHKRQVIPTMMPNDKSP